MTLLIGAIAAHLSGSLGFSTLIVAAVAASVMRLVAAVGRNALCEYGRAHLEGDDED